MEAAIGTACEFLEDHPSLRRFLLAMKTLDLQDLQDPTMVQIRSALRGHSDVSFLACMRCCQFELQRAERMETIPKVLTVAHPLTGEQSQILI